MEPDREDLPSTQQTNTGKLSQQTSTTVDDTKLKSGLALNNSDQPPESIFWTKGAI